MKIEGFRNLQNYMHNTVIMNSAKRLHWVSIPAVIKHIWNNTTEVQYLTNTGQGKERLKAREQTRLEFTELPKGEEEGGGSVKSRRRHSIVVKCVGFGARLLGLKSWDSHLLRDITLPLYTYFLNYKWNDTSSNSLGGCEDEMNTYKVLRKVQ